MSTRGSNRARGLVLTLLCVFAIGPAQAQPAASSGQSDTRSELDAPSVATPTPQPTLSPEQVRKAYMNCLFEVDKAEESLSLNRRARLAEAENQRVFCENRKKDCSIKKEGPDCRTFVEEFSSE